MHYHHSESPGSITATTAQQIRYRVQCGWWSSEPPPLAWHPRLPLLATGSSQDQKQLTDVILWNVHGSLITRLSSQLGLIHHAWSCDGKILAIASIEIDLTRSMASPRRSIINLWTIDGQHLRTMPGQQMRWNPVSYHVATTDTHDRSWRLWNITDGTTQVIDQGSGPSSPILPRTMVWSPRGVYLLGCWKEPGGTLIMGVWDRDGKVILRQHLDNTPPDAMVACHWHPDEETMLIIQGTTIRMLDLTGRVLHVFPITVNIGISMGSKLCQWSPDGHILVTSVGDTVQLWTPTGDRIATLQETGEILAIAWTPNGEVLATTAWSNRVCLWSRTGHKLAELPMNNPVLGAPSMQIAVSLAWDNTGQYLATSLRGGTVHLWSR